MCVVSCSAPQALFTRLIPASDVYADPDMLPKVQVDRGAIKFVLAGANIMWCVPLTVATQHQRGC